MVASGAFVAGPWRYARVEDAGHWLQLDRPDAVNELLLDFLHRTGRPPGAGPRPGRAGPPRARPQRNADVTSSSLRGPLSEASASSARKLSRGWYPSIAATLLPPTDSGQADWARVGWPAAGQPRASVVQAGA